MQTYAHTHTYIYINTVIQLKLLTYNLTVCNSSDAYTKGYLIWIMYFGLSVTYNKFILSHS